MIRLILSLLMVCYLVSLSACSTQPIIQKKIEYVYPPDTLLIKPCETVDAGDTVRTLSNAYVHNTTCANILQNQIKAIQEDIANKKKNNSK